jgi:esterase/lipase superfamily enzyme
LLVVSALAGGGYAVWKKGREAERITEEIFARGVSDVPFASSRGHVSDGKIQLGMSKYSYETKGKIPGFDGVVPDDDIFVVVHGLNNTETKAENRFALARESLQKCGYSGTVVGFSWDGSTNRDPFGATGYREAKHNSMATGPMLAQFLSDLHAFNPDAKIRIIGYSMGARLVVEALHVLVSDPKFKGKTWKLATGHLVGAAIDNEQLQVDDRYGKPIEQRVERFYNYYSPRDSKLGKYYKPLEADRAIGRSDIEDRSKAPRNYSSKNVSSELLAVDGVGNPVPAGERGRNHSAYLGIRNDFGEWKDDGAMDVVARDIR